MAVGALLLAFLVLYILNGGAAKKLFLVLAATIALTVVVITFSEQVFSFISRSGSADEIRSATSRTVIWPVALSMIQQSPLIGWGYASALTLLSEHPAIYFGAAHCHNIYIEVLFSGGLFGLFAFLWCVFISLVIAARKGKKEEIALMAFFLSYGITEPILSGPVGFGIMIWLTVIVLILARGPNLLLQSQRANENFLAPPA